MWRRRRSTLPCGNFLVRQADHVEAGIHVDHFARGGAAEIGQARDFSALKEDTSMEGVDSATLWLLTDLGHSTKCEIVQVDARFHMMGVSEEGE